MEPDRARTDRRVELVDGPALLAEVARPERRGRPPERVRAVDRRAIARASDRALTSTASTRNRVGGRPASSSVIAIE